MPDQPYSPGANALLSFGAGYQPAATGWPQQYAGPLQGLPGMSTPMGMLAGMSAMQFLKPEFDKVGMVPMGLNHDQNLLDRFAAMRYQQAQYQAMQKAVVADRAAIFETMRGVAHLTGTPFGARQEAYANTLAGGIASAAPWVVGADAELVDQLGGQRGSSVLLARRMIEAGRYRMDPVTGQMGISADTAAKNAINIFDDLMSSKNIGQMKGIRAGQVGSMVQELQARGMLMGGESQGMSLLDRQRSAFDSVHGRLPAPGELDKLSLDPGVTDKLHAADTDRIKRSIKAYTGAVAAMRDIFGDMGRQNAPMAELFAGLEALTQGSIAQIDPGRLSAMVRQTYNLSKATGVQLDAAIAMQQHAASRGQQLGLEPYFAVPALQGGLAFGGAYRAGGHGAFSAWGAPTADQAQQMDINLRQNATASNMANRLAVALRLANNGQLTAGSEAAAFAEAVRNGDASANLRISDRQFVNMMSSGSKMGHGEIMSLLNQRHMNRGVSAANPQISEMVRLSQGPESAAFVGRAMAGTLAARLQSQLGLSQAEAARVAAGIAQQVGSGALGLSAETFRNDASRNQAIGSLIEEGLKGAGLGGKLDALGADQAGFLRGAADLAGGSADRALMGRYGMTLQGWYTAFNPQTLADATKLATDSQWMAARQEALAGVGRGTLLSNMVDALQELKPDDPEALRRVLGRTLGGVRKDAITQAMTPVMSNLTTARADLDKIEAQIRATKDPARKRELMLQRDAKMTALKNAAAEVAKVNEQLGGLKKEDMPGLEGLMSEAGSESRQRLENVARPGEAGSKAAMIASSEMVTVYNKAMTARDDKAVEDFREKYKLTDEASWRRFGDDVATQNRLNQSDQKTKTGEAGTDATTKGKDGEAGPTGPSRMAITGELELVIKDDKLRATINGTGGRDFFMPG